MTKIKLTIHDEVNCTFEGISLVDRTYLFNKSKIYNPTLRFTPAVRLGRFDGKTPYFFMNGKTYINLLGPILEYLENKNYDIELIDKRTYNRNFEFENIDKNFLSNKVWPPDHGLAGQPIILRDHQVDIVNNFLNNPQGIISAPTASGKSLVTAILSQKVEKYGRTIVIVPTKDLITQTEKYYLDLGMDVGVYYGDRKQFFHSHTICTWQSLEKLRESPIDVGLDQPVTFDKFIQGVVAVIVDECHISRCESLSKLLSTKFAHIPIRWGVTGTIPKDDYEKVHLTIGIGDLIWKLATSELQELGLISNCNVKVIQMIDTQVFTSYANELDYLVSEPKRLEFMANLIIEASNSGNVLVLVGRKKTGKELEKLIPNSIFLSGETKSSTRKEHYSDVATMNDKIVIASFGIASCGIDVPRVNHLVLVEAGKSFCKVVQSVGRALRTAADKDFAQIWDICSTCNWSKKHLGNRKKFYKEQRFPFTIEKVEWNK